MSESVLMAKDGFIYTHLYHSLSHPELNWSMSWLKHLTCSIRCGDDRASRVNSREYGPSKSPSLLGQGRLYCFLLAPL